MIGPTIVHYESCYECDHCRYEDYLDGELCERIEAQCFAPELPKPRLIGNDYKTPDWCPCKTP